MVGHANGVLLSWFVEDHVASGVMLVYPAQLFERSPRLAAGDARQLCQELDLDLYRFSVRVGYSL